MNRLHALSLVLVSSTIGCGTVSTHRVMTAAAQAPVDPSGVRILLVGATLPATFREIAIVESVGRDSYADLEHVIDGLRAEAGRVGCSYIVQVRVDQGAGMATATGLCGIAP